MSTSRVTMVSAASASRLRSARLACGDLLEVVDVVDEAAFDLVHARVDVAGDGDVDEEHGAVAAAVQEVLAVRAAEDLLRRAGGGDDDVGAVGLLVELVEGDGSV